MRERESKKKTLETRSQESSPTKMSSTAPVACCERACRFRCGALGLGKCKVRKSTRHPSEKKGQVCSIADHL